MAKTKGDRLFNSKTDNKPIFHPGEKGFEAKVKGVQSVVGSVFDGAPCDHKGPDEGYKRLGVSSKRKGGQ